MVRTGLLVAGLALVALGCEDGAAPASLDGVFALVAENDQPLPSDQGEPSGCCLTLSGAITLAWSS